MRGSAKGCLLALGGAAILWLCAPLLVGLMFAVTSRIQYNSTPPREVGRLAITNAGITLVLWSKPQPRAICYEGDYRVLQVSRTDAPDQYYRLLPSLPGDDPAVSVDWFPDARCIRLVDSGMRRLPKEAVIDLASGRITDMDRGTNGVCVAYEPRRVMAELSFPPAADSWCIMSSDDRPVVPTGEVVRAGVLYRKQ